MKTRETLRPAAKKRIKDYIKGTGESQKDFSAALGIDPSKLSRILKGETRTAAGDLVAALAQKMNIDESALVVDADRADAASLPLFEGLGRDTGFVLPALLEMLVAIPPVICVGDGCSIFLEHNGRLHLAATTRTSLKMHLFGDKSYTTNPETLREAADSALAKGDGSGLPGGLTSWVYVYDCPLNLKNIRSMNDRLEFVRKIRAERDDATIPVPTWSNLMRGQYDHEPRPFLAVPMRVRGREKPIGVVRITTVRRNAAPFDETAVERLQRFADDLGEFIHAHDELRSPGYRQHFQIWAARNDLYELSGRLTRGVTSLFNVDTCSFFVRNGSLEERFVLQDTACHNERVPRSSRKWFERFARRARGVSPDDPIEYKRDAESKSSTCLKTQAAVMLSRHDDQEWTVTIGPDATAPLLVKASPQTDGADHICELPEDESRTIFLVPIRDPLHPRRLGGFLRIVSRENFEPDRGRELLEKLQHFAATFSTCLARATCQYLGEEAAKKITSFLSKPLAPKDLERKAARVIAQAISADAVSIFELDSDGKLRSSESKTYLNEDQLWQDYSVEEVEQQLSNHHYFKTVAVKQQSYSPGEAKTGYPLKNKRGVRVLNIKDMNDKSEIKRYDIESEAPASYAHCEISPAGSFLSAAITLGDENTTFGVVRALRLKQSPHGPFLQHHEAILASCCTMLAALIRTQRRTSVVISYSRECVEELRLLADVLEDIGYRPRFLDPDTPLDDPMREFRALIDEGRRQRGSVLGIALLNGDVRAVRNTRIHHEPPETVQAELATMIEALGPDSVLAVKHRGVTHNPMTPSAIHEIEFEYNEHGVAVVLPGIIKQLKSMPR